MINLHAFISFIVLMFMQFYTVGQPANLWNGEYYGTTTIDGQTVKILIIDGDTIPVVDLEGIQITQKRNFKSRDERKRYRQWRKYAAKVYPYAAEAIRIFRQLQEDTKNMKKGKKRKYGRKKEKELKPKYAAELKKLTKSQGFILIKMVERELNKPFFDVVVQIEGRWAAMKWQTLGKWYGYNLKKGYNPEKDPLLESILSDLNISYGNKNKSEH
jgi:hypothetical protein